MLFWDNQSKLKCGHAYCENDSVCHHFEVDDDDDDGLDRKRLMLSVLLECDCNEYSGVMFIEEVVVDQTEISFDPSVTNKTSNPRHTYFASRQYKSISLYAY